MQTLLQVVCTKGKSVRDAIANDPRLKDNGLKLIKERKPGRKPGWTKIKGMCGGPPGLGEYPMEWKHINSHLSRRQ